MTAIADLWPLLLIAGCGFLVYALLRLTRRFSPGAVSAGPRLPAGAINAGQSEVADDLRHIERRLDTRPDSLIHRIEESCRELGVATNDGATPDGVPMSVEQHIGLLLDRLEARLELPPIVTDAPSADPGPSSPRLPRSTIPRSTSS
jgi:hypothetical protein